MKIAICEDTWTDTTALVTKLAEYYPDEAPDLYASAAQLLEVYDSGNRYDLIFMDIEMPGTNGFEAAQALHRAYHDEFPLIVFLSVTGSYVYKAYHIGWAYERKPITSERLFEVLNSAAKELSLRKVDILTTEGMVFFNIQDIMYLETYYGKVRVVTTGRVFITKTSLAVIADRLKKCAFATTHRCYLVNLRHVVLYQERAVFLSNNRVVPLSRNYRKSFSRSMIKYLNGSFL